jgi:hypothetical protein
VQQLQRGAGVDDDRIVVRAAGAHVGPVTERRPQALPTRPHQVPQRDERLGQIGVDVPPPCDLVVEQRLDARFDAAADLGQARRDLREPPRLRPRRHREIVRCRPARRMTVVIASNDHAANS